VPSAGLMAGSILLRGEEAGGTVSVTEIARPV
jgi:hypothetical protein